MCCQTQPGPDPGLEARSAGPAAATATGLAVAVEVQWQGQVATGQGGLSEQPLLALPTPSATSGFIQ